MDAVEVNVYMCMYVRVCMHMHICTCVSLCECTCLHLYLMAHMCSHTSVCILMHLHMCLYMYLCISACAHACMCVCKCVLHICVWACTCVWESLCVCVSFIGNIFFPIYRFSRQKLHMVIWELEVLFSSLFPIGTVIGIIIMHFHPIMRGHRGWHVRELWAEHQHCFLSEINKQQTKRLKSHGSPKVSDSCISNSHEVSIVHTCNMRNDNKLVLNLRYRRAG